MSRVLAVGSFLVDGVVTSRSRPVTLGAERRCPSRRSLGLTARSGVPVPATT